MLDYLPTLTPKVIFQIIPSNPWMTGIPQQVVFMDAHTLVIIRVATEAMHLSIKKNGGDGAGKVQDQTKMYVHI